MDESCIPHLWVELVILSVRPCGGNEENEDNGPHNHEP